MNIRKVVGTSMLPQFQPGEILLFGKRASVRPGMVVLATVSGREVMKRVKRIQGKHLWLEGDNRKHSTDSRHYGEVAISDIHAVCLLTLKQLMTKLITGSLATLLLFMAFGQVISGYDIIAVMQAYGLGVFTITVSTVLLGLELFAAYGLLTKKHYGGWVALLCAALWSLVAAQAYVRGAPVLNCGCFGIYFAQPLTAFTLLQDLVFVGWAGSVYYLNAHKKTQSLRH